MQVNKWVLSCYAQGPICYLQFWTRIVFNEKRLGSASAALRSSSRLLNSTLNKTSAKKLFESSVYILVQSMQVRILIKNYSWELEAPGQLQLGHGALAACIYSKGNTTSTCVNNTARVDGSGAPVYCSSTLFNLHATQSSASARLCLSVAALHSGLYRRRYADDLWQLTIRRRSSAVNAADLGFTQDYQP